MSCFLRFVPFRSLTLAVLALAWILSPASSAIAQEAAVESDVAEETQSAAEAFPIPDDLKTADEYFEFIEQVSADSEVDDDSPEARKKLENKMAETVLDVVDRVLKLELTEDEAAQAFYFRLQAARVLEQNRAPGGSDKMQQAIEAARKYPDSNVQAVGIKFFIEGNFQRWPTLKKSEKEAMLEEVKEFLVDGDPDPYRVNTLLTILSVLQQVQDEALAKPLLAALVPRFEESDNERIRQMAEKLGGTLRRLKLPGSEMELSGKLLNGEELDWESYRGKVVLVDFWATWCGPCRQEVPNVLRLYQQYHDQGFEVVGVSLDSEKEQAESYIEQYDLPWPNIFSPNEDERAWDAPMAVHYGVMGIPLAILIDTDGKVVSLEARGENLAKLLKEMLGKP